MAENWTESDQPAVPDLPGTVRVYKDMRVIWGQLHSIRFKTAWQAQSPMTAQCNRIAPGVMTIPDRCKRAPGPDCFCGFYGYYLPDGSERSGTAYSQSNSVQAVCEAEGLIIPSSLGIRAERMTVKAALVNEPYGSTCPDEVPAGLPSYTDRNEFLADWPPRDDISAITGKTAEQMTAEWEDRNPPNRDFTISSLSPCPCPHCQRNSSFSFTPGTTGTYSLSSWATTVHHQTVVVAGAPLPQVPAGAFNVTIERRIDGTTVVSWDE